MISYEDAICKIANAGKSIIANLDSSTESLPLLDCRKRILATDLKAKISSPPFTNSAMDGFAIVHEEAAEDRRLSIGETIFAKPTENLPAKAPRQCVRIMTGAPVPIWADTVVPVENCTVTGSDVVIDDLPAKGMHVRHEAEDVKKDSVVLKKGTFLDPERIMVAASFGYSKIEVAKKPKVGIFTTGDELCLPGEDLKPGSIYNSSRYFLESGFSNLGIPPCQNTLLRDEPEIAKREINKFLDSKEPNHSETTIVVTTGAVSAGEKDFIPNLAREMGFEAIFHKVAIRPGKPVFLAQKLNENDSKTFWVGLAGNAISTMVGFHFFLEPLLEECGLLPKIDFREVEIEEDFSKPKHLKCFFRAKVSGNKARLFHQQGSARVEASALANAYVVLPEGVTTITAGTKIKARLI